MATASSLSGFESGAALATMVGVLIEVRVMPSIVRIASPGRSWYGRGPWTVGSTPDQGTASILVSVLGGRFSPGLVSM